MEQYEIIFLCYFVIVNIYGFAIMGMDKKKAIRGEYRIPEASLFWAAIAGGSIGCIAGMQHFRHKTRHWYFKYGMPLILAVQLCLAALYIYFFKI